MYGKIRLIELPTDTLRDLRNYVGSFAASADGSTIAVSSPEGYLLTAIGAEQKRPVLVETLRNGCGLAADQTTFVATSGMGEMVGIAGAERPLQTFDFLFDNHMLRLTGRSGPTVKRARRFRPVAPAKPGSLFQARAD